MNDSKIIQLQVGYLKNWGFKTLKLDRQDVKSAPVWLNMRSPWFANMAMLDATHVGQFYAKEFSPHWGKA